MADLGRDGTVNNPGETAPGDTRWHEYAVGMRTEWAYAVGFAMVPFLGGLVVSVVSMIVIGVVGEEGVITDALARSIPLYRAEEVSNNLDLLLRMSLLPVVAFAYLGFLAITLAETVIEVRVSKALVAAAADGDPRLVPEPPHVLRTVGPKIEFLGIDWKEILRWLQRSIPRNLRMRVFRK